MDIQQQENALPVGADFARSVGRPSSYSPKIAAEICGEIVKGKSLRTICAADGMPRTSTIFVWLNAYPEFKEQYARSKEEQAEAFIEEMHDIADDGTNDWMEVHDKDGACIGYKLNGEHVQRSKLRIDTRKWVASKLKPKKYGDKQTVDVNHTGEIVLAVEDRRRAAESEADEMLRIAWEKKAAGLVIEHEQADNA